MFCFASFLLPKQLLHMNVKGDTECGSHLLVYLSQQSFNHLSK